MVTIQRGCKFCGRLIDVKIDESYATDEDPYKLLPLAACNRCADLHVDRRKLLERIGKTVRMIQNDKAGASREQCRNHLVVLTKRYVRLVADWTAHPELIWSDFIVDAIMQQPDDCSEILNRVWP